MKLLLLLAVSTLIVGSINAAILSDTQHITNELDKQIAELYKTRSVDAGLRATAEYFKAPDTSELQSNALHLVHERLAPAAEFLKSPELPKRSSNTKVENSLDAAAVYFKTPELPNHHKGVDRVAESLAATAGFVRKPDSRKRSSSTKVGNSLAAGAVYFRAPESPKLNIRNVRATKNSDDAVNYSDVRRKIAAARRRLFETTTTPVNYSDVRRKIAAARRRMFGTTTEADIRYY